MTDATNLPLRMPAWSRYAGALVDASNRRSIELREPDRDSLTTDAECKEATVDFFYHAGAFWTAVIPLDGVESICGQAFNFSRPRTRSGPTGREYLFDRRGRPRRTIPCLNHVQTRFNFQSDRSVFLFPLGAKEFHSPAVQIGQIVYSIEAIGPAGVGFNLRDALAGNLLSAHRFFSLEEMVFERLVLENQFVAESPPLPLSAEQRRALLIASLLRGDRAAMSEVYYLYRCFGTNNCTSNPFQIVDQVVHYRFMHWIGSMLYRLPLSPRGYLRIRGLDSDPSRRKLVRDEFAEYLAAPETRQRKRTLLKQRGAERRKLKQQ